MRLRSPTNPIVKAPCRRVRSRHETAAPAQGVRDREMFSRKSANPRAGFNLIEIALAIFVLTLGLLSIFGLFPHGLGMADTARQETQSCMFSDCVLSTLRARVAAAQNWVPSAVELDGVPEIEDDDSDPHLIRHTGGGEAHQRLVRFPAHTDSYRHSTYLRYTLELGSAANGQIGTAELSVWPGRRGGQKAVFYTEFFLFQEIEP